MAEYIEREVVLKWFEPYLGGGETWVEIHPVLDAIHTFPTADVAPVRHGRWEHDHYEDCTEQFEIVKCSNCGIKSYKKL